MFNQEDINKDLREKDSSESKLQTELLDIYRPYIFKGSSEMNKYWSQWDKNQVYFKSYRPKDSEDVANINKGGTEKVIIPLSYAQVQTAAAGILNMYMQKETLFELMSYGPEDQNYVLGMERVLDYQVRQNKIYRKLYLYIVDSLIKGVSGFRVDWEKITKKYRVREKVEKQSIFSSLLAPLGLSQMVDSMIKPSIETKEVVKELTQYEGNVIDNLNMYSFYPDPTVSLLDFQKGSFCAVEQIYPYNVVLENEGKLYHGTKRIKADTIYTWEGRKRYSGLTYDNQLNPKATFSEKLSPGKSVSLVEMYIKIIPSEFSKKCGVDIGDEKEPKMFVLVVANDTKIIRFEPYNELHGRFPFALGQYSPNLADSVGHSMVDLLSGLQQLITWLINSHMKNVRQTVNNRFIVDPSKVEIKDIESGSPVIRVKLPGNLSNSIQQLGVVDVTANHIPFVSALQGIAQIITGINENAMGMYSGGRRSAAQTRSITNAGQVRLGMIANLLWEGIEEVGILMLSNTQQFMSETTYNQILGDAKDKYPFDKVVLADPEQIAAAYNFAPLEAMSDSNKSFIFSMFKELIGSADLVQATGLDVNKIVEYMFTLAGVKNYDWFKTAQAAAPVPNTTVVPDNQITNGLNNGNLQPMPNGAGDIVGSLLSSIQ